MKIIRKAFEKNVHIKHGVAILSDNLPVSFACKNDCGFFEYENEYCKHRHDEF